MAWQLIETAPTDGTPVKAGAMSRFMNGIIPYPVTSRFLGGQWCAELDGKWVPYDPQPTHWTERPTTKEPDRHET